MTLFDSPADARGFLKNLALVFGLLLGLVLTPVSSFQVRGGSMQPKLADGERVLVERITPRLHEIQRGDIVVFRHPRDPERFLIKRVVGLAGETVEIKQGQVLVNGRPLAESYVPREFHDDGDHSPVTLTDSQYFVLGDRRADSEDSRSWGALGNSLLVGRAILAYWPPSEAGPIR